MKNAVWIPVLLLVTALLPAEEPLIVRAEANHPDFRCKRGEEIVFTFRLLREGKAATDGFLRCKLYHNNLLRQELLIPAKEPAVLKTSLDAPGWVHATAAALDDEKKEIPWREPSKNRWSEEITGVCEAVGVVVEPETFRPARPCPDDFADFWQSQRRRLDQVPPRADRTPLPVPEEWRDKVRLYDVRIDCAGDRPATGYLTMPAAAEPRTLPAVVYFRGWGFYTSLPHFHVGQTAIAFELNAHGIENGRDKSYYKAFFDGPERLYQYIGKENRDEFYFLGIYLRVMRALDYVKSLPEWNGRDLVVYGGSKGGAQAIAAAGLDEQVSFCCAFVPAMCDHSAGFAGRQPGWPALYDCRREPPSPDVVKTADYFDNCNFARQIRCPVHLTIGLADAVCSPSSVFAFYNLLREPKSIVAVGTGKHNTKPVAGVEEMRRILESAPAGRR